MASIRKILWWGIVALCVLVTAELMARLDDAIRSGVPFLSSPSETDLTMRDSLGTRGRPFAQYRQWQLNGAGFRGPEVEMEAAEGCVRVAVLGASESFGYYESPRGEYPAQLADSLQRLGCYEVINAAVAGMSLPGQIQHWEKWVSRFKPDLVLIYATPAFYLANDPPRFTEPPRSGAAPLKRRFAWRLLDRLKSRLEYPEFIQRRRVSSKIESATRGKPGGWVFDSLPIDRLQLFEQHLDSMVTSVLGRGALPVLVTHSMRFADPPIEADRDLLRSWRQFTPRATEPMLLRFERESAAMVRRLAASREIPLVDADSVLTGRNEWFADFTHFNDQGAAVMAGTILNVLQSVDLQHRAYPGAEGSSGSMEGRDSNSSR